MPAAARAAALPGLRATPLTAPRIAGSRDGRGPRLCGGLRRRRGARDQLDVQVLAAVGDAVHHAPAAAGLSELRVLAAPRVILGADTSVTWIMSGAARQIVNATVDQGRQDRVGRRLLTSCCHRSRGPDRAASRAQRSESEQARAPGRSLQPASHRGRSRRSNATSRPAQRLAVATRIGPPRPQGPGVDFWLLRRDRGWSGAMG